MKMHPFLQFHEKLEWIGELWYWLVGLMVFTKRSSLGVNQNLS